MPPGLHHVSPDLPLLAGVFFRCPMGLTMSLSISRFWRVSLFRCPLGFTMSLPISRFRRASFLRCPVGLTMSLPISHFWKSPRLRPQIKVALWVSFIWNRGRYPPGGQIPVLSRPAGIWALFGGVPPFLLLCLPARRLQPLLQPQAEAVVLLALPAEAFRLDPVRRRAEVLLVWWWPFASSSL